MAADPDHGAAAGGAGGGDLMERVVDGAIRLGQAWKALTRERRLAAVAAAVLWLTLFLPWYQASVVSRSPRTKNAVPVGESLSGWAAFGLVQALILIASVGLLVFLFLRAEGRIGQLPGGDGWTITAAGGFCVLLVILGLFNAPTPATHGQYMVSTGLEWGIFLALISAVALTWAGGRIRSSLEDDPFLAGHHRVPQHRASDRPVGARESPAADAQPEPATGRVDPAEDRTRVTATAEPLTAAASGRGSAHPTPVPADPRPAPAPAPRADARPAPAPAPDPDPATVNPAPAGDPAVPGTDGPDRHEEPTEPRSPWRPAERPDWTDPERPMGWLTARPKPGSAEQAEETDE